MADSAKLSSFSMNVVIMVSISMLVNLYFFYEARRYLGRGRDLVRVETDSGNLLDLDSRLTGMPLKVTCVCIRRTSSHVFHTGTYIDKKCPFTGNVSIRGRIIAGTCHSAKMNRTIIVRRNYLHFIKKYQRYEKRHSNIPAHVSPCFRVKEGDHVTIGQCRPISKTVRFNVLKVLPAGSSNLAKKAFTGI
ncbi:hypothetical protein KIW84_060452 [Lathyrus oleraceus]|uniref:Small ribosomal subunit protein uS17 n=1 Tax=Pisum sativum TaxID=3888 RepID=A0A9D4W2D9_PEA|nr:hypothetical protein KIW84_060452 [Pisum sativum]